MWVDRSNGRWRCRTSQQKQNDTGAQRLAVLFFFRCLLAVGARWRRTKESSSGSRDRVEGPPPSAHIRARTGADTRTHGVVGSATAAETLIRPASTASDRSCSSPSRRVRGTASNPALPSAATVPSARKGKEIKKN